MSGTENDSCGPPPNATLVTLAEEQLGKPVTVEEARLLWSLGLL